MMYGKVSSSIIHTQSNIYRMKAQIQKVFKKPKTATNKGNVDTGATGSIKSATGKDVNDVSSPKISAGVEIVGNSHFDDID